MAIISYKLLTIPEGTKVGEEYNALFVKPQSFWIYDLWEDVTTLKKLLVRSHKVALEETTNR